MMPDAAFGLPQSFRQLARRRGPLGEQADDPVPRRVPDRLELLRGLDPEHVVELVIRFPATRAHHAPGVSSNHTITCSRQSLNALGLHPPNDREARRTTAPLRASAHTTSCLRNTSARRCSGSEPGYILHLPLQSISPLWSVYTVLSIITDRSSRTRAVPAPLGYARSSRRAISPGGLSLFLVAGWRSASAWSAPGRGAATGRRRACPASRRSGRRARRPLRPGIRRGGRLLGS